MDDLLLIEEKIDLEVRSLETCMFDHKTFSDILNRVQKAVDDLNLHSYSNLPIWVNKLDIEVGVTKQQYKNYLLFHMIWLLTAVSWKEDALNISRFVSLYVWLVCFKIDFHFVLDFIYFINLEWIEALKFWKNLFIHLCNLPQSFLHT